MDYGLDTAVVVWLARERGLAGRGAWVSCTAALILLPLITVNIFSIVWHHEDHTGAHCAVQYSTVQFNLQCTMAASVHGRGPAQRESEGWWWSAICCLPDPSPGTYTSSYLNII